MKVERISLFTLLAVFVLLVGIIMQLSCTKQKQSMIFRYVPSEPQAFAHLPRDQYGMIDWVRAIEKGIIEPKDSLNPNQKPSIVLDLDVIFESKGGMPGVLYPHKPHTEWLDCSNCHPNIFKMQKGANPITMLKIVSGEYCGRCHGKVAFPLSNCLRCHRLPAKGPNKKRITVIDSTIEEMIKRQEESKDSKILTK